MHTYEEKISVKILQGETEMLKSFREISENNSK